MPYSYFAFTWAQIAWIAFAVFWVMRRKDELPLIVTGALFYIFSFRFWALIQGWTSPANISNFGFENPTFDSLLEAHGLAVLGESVFLVGYLLAQTRRIEVPRVVASESLTSAIRSIVFIGIAICIPLAISARLSVAAQA